MVTDEVYELCLPVLHNASIDDEDKTDKLEELLKNETTLSGSSLESAILDVLWRFRESSAMASSPVPIRHSVLRRASPAPWQIPRANATPISSSPRLGVSPLAPADYVPPVLNRALSSTASPFTSPRPSPRLNFSNIAIPHSPNLNAYEFPSDTSPTQDIYGDYGSENVDWLVNDDGSSNTSSIGGHSGLNAAAAEYVQPQQTDMSPYDMLRSILGPSKTDDEIEAALAMHGYDLSATIMAFMEGQGAGDIANHAQTAADSQSAVLIGKSMTQDVVRPVTPSSQQRSGIVCRYWMSTGQCLRADCKFSHDLSNHICKYWVMGNCLAGDSCIFSHDPSHFMNRLALEESSTPPLQSAQPSFQFQDFNTFPSLQSGGQEQWSSNYQESINTFNYPFMNANATNGAKGSLGQAIEANSPRSRPGSRQAREPTPAAPALDDNEAFPSLSAVAAKAAKKHHGKRGGHGHGHKESPTPNSLAEVVKMSPSPAPGSRHDLKKLGRNSSSSSIRNGENSVAAQAIPSPRHIPWLETGDKANKAYLKARQDAIKHGGLRNKFLQSAAQAWNRNDARAAKALSLRGQSENDLMRKAHREAARELYEERNKPGSSSESSSSLSSFSPSLSGAAPAELYVDLHGLHPDEAVEYLERVLLEHQRSERPIYAITGTGHHSKNGKDKVGKAIRAFLNEWRYAFREFSVPGDRNNVGGILGVDARSWDKSMAREGSSTTTTTTTAAAAGGRGVAKASASSGSGGNSNGNNKAADEGGKARQDVDILSQGHEIGDGKVRLLVRDRADVPKGPAAGRAR